LQRTLAPLGEVTATHRPDIDLASADSILSHVRKVQPTVIVNAAAYTAVDKAESEPELAMAINAEAPRILAEEAKRIGATLVHYSTDYVFDGTKQSPYTETDTPNPLNVYGRSKLEGDRAIEAVGGEYVIFRTTWVYGARGSNFLLTMLRLAEKPELRIVDDQIGAPTTSECIAQTAADVLAQVLAPSSSKRLSDVSGVYNLSCGGETSWFGFTKEIFSRHAQAKGTSVPKLIPISTAEYASPARRPANSRLSCERLERTFGIRLPHWSQALSRVMDRLAQSASGEASVR
jgi:dTDP-4-dehydrorhamnose reductase